MMLRSHLSNHSAFNACPIVGLTGSIGAGKSTVARMLAALGCVVSSSDDLARLALHAPAIRQEIIDRWGDVVVSPTGEIDRSALAHIVFNNTVQRKALESIIHPWIEARRKEQFAAAPRGTRALVIDAPLLVEAGLDEQCDAVILVDADRDIRLARLAKSRGWDEAELARREASQLPLDQKRKRADDVILNNGDLESLRNQVQVVLSRISRSA